MTQPDAPRMVAFDCGQSSDGPCEWPVDMGCCSGVDLSTVDPAIVEAKMRLAADLIWMFSGRRFGLCEITLRPCNRCCGFDWPTPNIRGGQWFNSCGCQSFSDCSCGPISELCLPGPIQEIVAVRINGELLDPDQYRVDNWKYLIRIDGGEWPACQHLDADDDEDGAFAITYRRGIPVPRGGAWAAGQLACELIKDCIGDKSCRLPRNVSSINRQGVSIDFAQQILNRSHYKTGLADVDLWLQAVNPDELKSHSDVWSPDLCGKSRRVTWRSPK